MVVFPAQVLQTLEQDVVQGVFQGVQVGLLRGDDGQLLLYLVVLVMQLLDGVVVALDHLGLHPDLAALPTHQVFQVAFRLHP